MSFLFRRSAQVAASSPDASPARVSFLKRTWCTEDKTARRGRSPTVFATVLLILVVLALGKLYLFVDRTERNYPKPPPLGILTGELLKGFDRYSPEDNRSEEVLAEAFGAYVKPDVPCITPGCQWLERELNGTAVGRSSAACDNFYSHVCGGRTDVPASLYQRAAEDLMVAVVDHLLTAASHLNSDDGTAEHLRMLRGCIDGEEEATQFALACDFSTRSSVSDLPCPDHYPLVPRTVADIIFKSDSTTGAEELVSRIERSLREMNASVTLEQPGRKRPRVMTTERVHSVCRWLADSAGCHLRALFRNGSEDGEVTRRYQRLWNELFFAPLSLSQFSFCVYEFAALESLFHQKQPCMHCCHGLLIVHGAPQVQRPSAAEHAWLILALNCKQFKNLTQ